MVMNTTFAIDPAEGFSLGEKLLDKNDNGYFVAYASSERLKPPTFSSRRRLLASVPIRQRISQFSLATARP